MLVGETSIRIPELNRKFMYFDGKIMSIYGLIRFLHTTSV